MTEVKWIKIVSDIFDDEKILLIDGLPEHDAIIVIWFKLLCLAGKQNNSGVFMISDKIAYTDEMLATIFHRPLNTVRLALSIFQKYGMIEIVDNTITIPNWNKYQNLESIEQAREATRKRVQKFREKQRLLTQGEECNVTVTLRNADRRRIEEDIDSDIEKEKDKRERETPAEPEEEQSKECPYEKIQKQYNDICISFPSILEIDGNRRKAVSARWRAHPSLDTFEELFKIAESSAFLKGENDRNWSADFDWMMRTSNFAKILEHKYDTFQNKKTKDEDKKLDFNLEDFFEKPEVRK